MSAWAAFGLLGLYPLAGTQTYILGIPAFPNATLALPTPALRYARSAALYEATAVGPTTLLTIVAHNFSETNIWAYRATINGIELPTPFVNHSQLVPPLLYQPHGGGLASGDVSTARRGLTSGPSLLEFWLCDEELPWGSQV
jgi:hypothetical protein